MQEKADMCVKADGEQYDLSEPIELKKTQKAQHRNYHRQIDYS